jgi:mannose-6-phosphate isomerase-like protein (cupin superfamily)
VKHYITIPWPSKCFIYYQGTATFEVEQQIQIVTANHAVHILPETEHRIVNNGENDLHFIVISEPKAHGDRVNIDVLNSKI